MKLWKGRGRPMSTDAFDRAAAEIGCTIAAVRAVWQVESSGRPFLSDGSLVRRFEPHKFPRKHWSNIGFHPGSLAPWRASLKIGSRTRENMFNMAHDIDPDAALRATSWGGPQIMGFNAEMCGFNDAAHMVQSMADDEDAHLESFIGFCRSAGLFTALVAQDWRAVARGYNGGGQVDEYARRMRREYNRFTAAPNFGETRASRIETAYRSESGKRSAVVLRRGSEGPAVRKLQEALGIQVDGIFGGETDRAVRGFQRLNDLHVDGVVGAVTWAALKDRTGVKPEAEQDVLDATLDRIRKVSAVATGLGGIVSGAADKVADIPEVAQIVLFGAVGVALVVAVGAWSIRMMRRSA